ncbi:NADH dehydrogenase [Caldanaerobacter subterraneus subsp. tengcongensis MB4]|uniref:NADH:ubiquinone reductase (non-electrogenic) n=3 Tax=Bacillota TaxID=1239 RepID=Q8R7C9_CALS4|nr:FAD-dependent oxidoreductase [Caldanaerobacter subterraneus]AAM25616.1 NADH dehydrogenase, FAD-containing subunit [Caldanaerobacter subterraneus subsp. tengcongensis MB4]KKC28918.1 NADH dehydrogenase, FAD-containing subunit [Caldanaerobacter subterraneus subsp. pacificus DSM 12653]MCS3917512.1 NADH dehydrogenase [Caldanaerobacter subterraneus subsp. tengcongensis MB4]
MGNNKKIVIIGAGYGGLHAAKLLNKKLKNNPDIEVTLIDKKPYHTLLTDLHEVAGSRIEPDSVRIYLHKVFAGKRVNIILDEIEKIDHEKQQVIGKKGAYQYDYLILGIGSEPCDFGIPGVFEYGFNVGSLEAAIRTREHIEEMFRKASVEKDPDEKKKMLTFVIAGAGFTGIETAGELMEWTKSLCDKYNLDRSEIKIMVVEALNTILPNLNAKLAIKAQRFLNKKGVEVLTNSPIVEVARDYVVLKDGRKIETKTLIWTCGVQGNKCVENFGLELNRRCRVQTNEYMQAVGKENIYVIGDLAYYEIDGKPIPQVVETALQSAETAVHNIVADIKGEEKKPFKPKYHGFMVSIGSRYAVAELMGVSLTGFLAMAIKHLVNMHYLFGVAGIDAVLSYIYHEFFEVKNNRSILGGHIAAHVPTFWLVLLRIYVGALWLIEGINKIQQGWLDPSKIFIITASDVSGATANATSGATAVQTLQPLLKEPPAFYKWFMDTFVVPHAFLFQVMVVLAEVAIGLALIAGLFTFLASAGSIFLALNFILSAMADKSILWYIFAAIALMGGAGRSFGLDYYVIPWIKNWWKKTTFARKTYLYIS